MCWKGSTRSAAETGQRAAAAGRREATREVVVVVMAMNVRTTMQTGTTAAVVQDTTDLRGVTEMITMTGKGGAGNSVNF